MNKTISTEQATEMQDIIAIAKKQILEKTGVEGKMQFIPKNVDELDAQVVELFTLMCSAWGINLEDIRQKSKKGDLATIRALLWYVGYKLYPAVGTKRFAAILGREHHTSVLAAVKKAQGFLDTRDPLFMYYYNRVKHLLNEQ